MKYSITQRRWKFACTNRLLIHIVVSLFPQCKNDHESQKSRIKYCVKLPNAQSHSRKRQRKKECDTIDLKTKGDSSICYKFLLQHKKRPIPFFALCACVCARLWIRFMSQINHLLLPIEHRNCETHPSFPFCSKYLLLYFLI